MFAESRSGGAGSGSLCPSLFPRLNEETGGERDSGARQTAHFSRINSRNEVVTYDSRRKKKTSWSSRERKETSDFSLTNI